MEGRTEGRTEGRKDGETDKTVYRVADSRLKIESPIHD